MGDRTKNRRAVDAVPAGVRGCGRALSDWVGRVRAPSVPSPRFVRRRSNGRPGPRWLVECTLDANRPNRTRTARLNRPTSLRRLRSTLFRTTGVRRRSGTNPFRIDRRARLPLKLAPASSSCRGNEGSPRNPRAAVFRIRVRDATRARRWWSTRRGRRHRAPGPCGRGTKATLGRPDEVLALFRRTARLPPRFGSCPDLGAPQPRTLSESRCEYAVLP